eukprot:7041882-Ditylum_brightwellii.AAC.1
MNRLEYTKGWTNLTINDQIKSKIVKIISNAGIRYISKGEKEKVDKAVHKTRDLFGEIQRHRATLLSCRKTLFDTPLLREIAKAQNVNGVAPGNLLREKLSGLMGQANIAIQKWPSRYHKKKKEDTGTSVRIGEAILSELDAAIVILSQHCAYLEEQQIRNDDAAAWDEPPKPTTANIKWKIWNAQA